MSVIQSLELLNTSVIRNHKTRELYRAKFASAKPYKHLVFDELFSETLLEQIAEEFKSRRRIDMVTHNNGLEKKKIGTRPNPALGPAAQNYFNAIHSGSFVDFLSDITGIEGLLPDPGLVNGGLHEIPQGGAFAPHVDFAKHPVTRLDNRLVFITYLNRGWHPSYGGGLELWDGTTKTCVETVYPIFGRSVLLYHSSRSWHGHPVPVNTPDGSTRKSVAAYYYSNGRNDEAGTSSVALNYDNSEPLWPTQLVFSKKVKHFLQLSIPPIALNWARDLRDSQRRKAKLKM